MEKLEIHVITCRKEQLVLFSCIAIKKMINNIIKYTKTVITDGVVENMTLIQEMFWCCFIVLKSYIYTAVLLT